MTMHATTRAGASLRAKGDQGRSREIVLTKPTRSVNMRVSSLRKGNLTKAQAHGITCTPVPRRNRRITCTPVPRESRMSMACCISTKPTNHASRITYEYGMLHESWRGVDGVESPRGRVLARIGPLMTFDWTEWRALGAHSSAHTPVFGSDLIGIPSNTYGSMRVCPPRARAGKTCVCAPSRRGPTR